MEIAQAQKDVRDTFLGGFAGQLVSAIVWSASAAACTWHSFRLGEIILLAGGFFIFPLTQLLLRVVGHAYALPKGHPMNALGIQVAFSLPLTLPVVIGAAVLRPSWFYPAFMIALGAHYLPFVFMYGMRQFALLCAILVTSGVAIGMYLPTPLSFGAWLRQRCCLSSQSPASALPGPASFWAPPGTAAMPHSAADDSNRSVFVGQSPSCRSSTAFM